MTTLSSRDPAWLLEPDLRANNGHTGMRYHMQAAQQNVRRKATPGADFGALAIGMLSCLPFSLERIRPDQAEVIRVILRAALSYPALSR